MSNVIKAIASFKEKGYTDSNFSDNEKDLITSLYKMNYDAVNYRYNENNKFRFKSLPQCPIPDDYQMVKSVGCLIYQCSEGNIPNRKLYKSLVNVENKLALSIVMNSPEYENADWD